MMPSQHSGCAPAQQSGSVIRIAVIACACNFVSVTDTYLSEVAAVVQVVPGGLEPSVAVSAIIMKALKIIIIIEPVFNPQNLDSDDD